jgi:hypothetical protein
MSASIARVLSAARVAFAAAAAATMVAASPAAVGAQCAFDKPTYGSAGYTGRITASLVQAYVNCGDIGGGTPNVEALMNVPACEPPATFAQLGGSPDDTWRFSQVPGASYGKVDMKRTSLSGAPNLTDYPPTLKDVSVRTILKGIVRLPNDTPATGTGKVNVLLRATVDDKSGTYVTVVDFPLDCDITLHGRKADVTKRLGDAMIALGQPRLPDCANVELLSIAVTDPNGAIFAVPGLTLP